MKLLKNKFLLTCKGSKNLVTYTGLIRKKKIFKVVFKKGAINKKETLMHGPSLYNGEINLLKDSIHTQTYRRFGIQLGWDLEE